MPISARVSLFSRMFTDPHARGLISVDIRGARHINGTSPHFRTHAVPSLRFAPCAIDGDIARAAPEGARPYSFCTTRSRLHACRVGRPGTSMRRHCSFSLSKPPLYSVYRHNAACSISRFFFAGITGFAASTIYICCRYFRRSIDDGNFLDVDGDTSPVRRPRRFTYHSRG